MDNRYEIAEQNGMSREFSDWFFDNKKAGCGNVWFMMMAAMWEGWQGRAAMLQGAENAESPTTMQTAPSLDSSQIIAESPSGNSPVIPDAYDIEAFGIFSATEGESGLLLQIEQFWFGTENCPQIGKENMVPKFALQAIINRLQAHCNSMGEDTLIDIFASSAAPQQEAKNV